MELSAAWALHVLSQPSQLQKHQYFNNYPFEIKKKVFWGNLCLLHEAACSAEGVLLSNFTSMRSWGLNLIALPFFLTDASQMGDVYILTLLANGKQRARTVKVGSHQKMQRILQKLKSLSPYFFLHLYLDISKCERFPISVKP